MTKSEANKLNRLITKAKVAVANLEEALSDADEVSLEDLCRASEAFELLKGIQGFEAD